MARKPEPPAKAAKPAPEKADAKEKPQSKGAKAKAATEPKETAPPPARIEENLYYSNPRQQTNESQLRVWSKLVRSKTLGIFEEMRADDQVKAALELKKQFVLGPGRTVESPEGQAEDWEVTRFVQANFDKLPGTFARSLKNILSALDFGFSVTEKVLEEREDELPPLQATPAPDDTEDADEDTLDDDDATGEEAKAKPGLLKKNAVLPPTTKAKPSTGFSPPSSPAGGHKPPAGIGDNGGLELDEEPEAEPLGPKLWLKSLRTVAPFDIRFVTTEFGELTGVTQSGNRDKEANTTEPTPDIASNKLVVYSYAGEFGNWYGRSDLEAAHRAWFVKDQSYLYLGRLLERFGTPPVFIHYDARALTPDVQAGLKQAIQNWQNGMVAMFPRGEKSDSLDFWTPDLANQNGEAFDRAIRMFDQAISRAILMPGLIGATNDTAQGSLARSETHLDVFLMVIEFLRSELEELINDQIVKPLVDVNFVVDVYPRLKFLPLSGKTRSELIKLWGDLCGQKVVVNTPADERHIRKAMDFPDFEVAQESADEMGADNPYAPETGVGKLDPVTGQPIPPGQVDDDGDVVDADGDKVDPAQLEKNPGGTPPPPPGGAKGGKGTITITTHADQVTTRKHDVAPGGGVPPQTSRAGAADVAPNAPSSDPPTRRQLTAYERKVNFTAIEREMENLGAAYTERMRVAIARTRDELMQWVRTNYDGNVSFATSFAALPAADKWRETMGAFFKDAFDQGRESIRGEVPKAFAAQELPAGDYDKALEYLRTKAFAVTGVTHDRLLNDVRRALIQAISTGEPLDRIMERLRLLFEPYAAANAAAGGALLEPSRLETIVRTNLNDVFNMGRIQQAREAGDFLDGFQYSAIMDSRTTEVCQHLDGLVMRASDPRVDALRPPRHFNCLPGDSLVSTAYKITGHSKRWFEGQVAVIKTADALELTATPNHPILTQRGFVPAGRINVGDYVVRDIRQSGRVGVDIDHQTMPASIENVVRALSESRGMRPVSVPLAAKDFHDDAREGEVASIWSDSFLTNGAVARTLKALREFILVLGSQAKVSCARFALSGIGSLEEFGLSALHTVDRFVSPGDARRTGSQLYADRTKQPFDDGVRDAELARHILSGQAGEVELARVVSTDARDFSGHVYNLETASGYYTANGVIVHNCRSIYVPIIVGEEIDPASVITDEQARRADELSGDEF